MFHFFPPENIRKHLVGIEMEHWMVWLGEKEVLRKTNEKKKRSKIFIKNSCSHISKK